ncbi:neuronal-specific septin-3-like isoform X2 [Polypterus senegalus]|uniref:neuronal-specific septin-3-like isoform X2 n=1 Tax=Polypterus senegalus TaxID=55291 RepID=UPI001962CC86|nr:neuronal-specific septin-3-like isoform X2 [Polypterus senegalus]
MSDSTVNAHLEGIISDFEALKRSFEVEETDTSTHPSAPPRRMPHPNFRSALSTSVQRSPNSDLSFKPSEPSSQRSPKSSLKRVELTSPRLAEPVSRRTEVSIDISTKPVETSTTSISRFGLRRPEVQTHRSPEVLQKRVEISTCKTGDSVLRRTEPPVNRVPEPPIRKVELTATASAGDLAPRSSEISVSRPTETSASTRTTENSNHTEGNIQQVHPESKTQVLSTETPVAESNQRSAMAELSRELPSRQVPATDFSYVGIDSILEQMRRKAMKQGFEFNIMVVGQSGLGKSTLMNTLFKSKVSRRSATSTIEERIPKTVEIKSISHDIEEKGVRMKLTVIDTPGFGDHINNENCWQPVMEFINDQYAQYLQEEININRKKRIPDTRVHCCVYFIPPTGHSLRPLDVEFMRRLSKVVNIVPVIAKADTLTLEERDDFKKKIREELSENDIDVYPQKEFDEDAEDHLINEKIREMIPFAVVGSDQEYQVNGRRLLGRKTKWGIIEVENVAHCEFAYLRDLLIRTHMQNIKDITSTIHYEAYRMTRLNDIKTYTNGMNGHESTACEM